MADNLKAFMAESAIKYKEAEYVVSDRFRDEQGEAIKWKIKILTENESNKLVQQCRKRYIDPKTRQSQVETDGNKLNELLVANCVVYPNLNDAQLQDSYNTTNAVELAKEMLNPGEYADLIMAINQANGFKAGMADKIKRAKN